MRWNELYAQNKETGKPVIYPLRKYYLKRYGDTVRGVRAASKALHETELQTQITTNPWTGKIMDGPVVIRTRDLRRVKATS